MPAKIYNFGNESDLGSSTLLAEVVKTTTEELTYYVSTTGNDASDGLTPATSLLTIQAAVDKVPKFIEKYNVTINIGAGNFAGFYLFGFSVRRGTTFTIQGTLGAPTLTTGTTSGTATGGSTTQLIDAGQTWTINELRGRFVYVNSGYRVIRNNTANTINLIGPSSDTCNGKAYSLVEQKTVLNGPNAAYPTSIIFSNANVSARDNLIVADLKITGGTQGIFNRAGNGYVWRRLCVTGNSSIGGESCSTSGESQIEDCYFSENNDYGLVSVEVMGQCRMWRNYAYHNGIGFFLGGPGSFPSTNTDLYADNSTSTTYGAFFVGESSEFMATRIFSENNAGPGFMCWSPNHVTYLISATISSNGGHGIVVAGEVVLFTSTITGNTGYGIAIGEQSYDTKQYLSHGSLTVQSATVISGNTLGGISLRQKSIANIQNTSGSSTGYGIIVKEDSFVHIDSTTAITGTLGDATIDDGTTVLTWATDFSSNGDKINNLLNGCRIERQD